MFRNLILGTVACLGTIALAGGLMAQSGVTVSGTGGGPLDGSQAVDVDFAVTGLSGATVAQVSVDIAIWHDWVGDVNVTLTDPENNTHTIFEKIGGSTYGSDAHFGDVAGQVHRVYTFNDNGSEDIWADATLAGADAEIIPTGEYHTKDVAGNDTVMNVVFATTTATQANGTWTLSFADAFSGDDDGSIDAASCALTVATSTVNANPVVESLYDANSSPTTISHNDTISVAFNSNVASVDFRFDVTDPDSGDEVELKSTVSPSANINGFVQSEWDIALASQPVIPAAPSSGTFDAVGVITVTLDAADDSTGTDSLTFFIEVVNTIPGPYDIDFESGDGATDGWFTSGPDASLWEHGTPSSVGPAATNSGVSAWGTVIDGNHATSDAETYLNAPAVDLTGSSEPIASFFHHVDIEQGVNDYDGCTLQVSVNGGGWVSLLDTDPGFIQNGPNSSAIFANGEPGWTGDPTGTGWDEVVIDLLSLTSVAVTNTDTVRFRFWLATDGSVNDYPGWYIDDFAVDDAAEIDVQRPANVSLGDAATGPVSDSAGSILIGSAATFTYTIENLGGRPLGLTGTSLVIVTGEVNCTVSVDDSGTSTSIDGGATTTFDVDVTPTAGGVFSFSLEIDSNDSDENPYVIDVDGTGVSNAPPTVTVPAGSNWVDAGGGLLTLTLDPGDAISDSLEADDTTPDDMTVTVSPPGTALMTLTGGPQDVTTPTTGPITFQWMGTADGANTPGDYDWTIDIDDGTSVTSITARITINDVAPTHSIVNADSGDGSIGTPYATTFVEGDTGASSIDLASVTDGNTGQAVTIDAGVSPNPAQTAGPSGGTGFQFALSGDLLTVAPAGALVAGDVGTQVFDVTVTDGPNQVVITAGINVVGNSGAISFDNTSLLPTGEVNSEYSVTLTVSGATLPVTFGLANGTTLPAGLSLNSGTGEISGTPTAARTTQFDVRAVDDASDSATETFEIAINLESFGGSGDDDGDSGCSTGETPFSWMIVLGLLSAGILATRLRRSRASRPLE